ncbi:MAG: UDP-diphosphatase [Bacteroidetes bacterium]|nr:MAG: UDP-diphosphatase [Bacteroidota bacterium]
MSYLEALILGIIQGLTEFLPVSSSGHLELAKALMGVEIEEDVTFTVLVHGATVLSTLVIFRNDIWKIIVDSLKLEWNESAQYVVKIAISMVPVLFVGVFLKDELEALFNGNTMFVGSMLLITAILLGVTYFVKKTENEISYLSALIIGLAQAVAVLPGISRSGATIATGLLLGNKKESVTKFSFLMVLVPIIGANLLDVMDGDITATDNATPMLIGFIAAFFSGLLACKLMIKIVNSGKLLYFAAYCLLVGVIAIYFG